MINKQNLKSEKSTACLREYLFVKLSCSCFKTYFHKVVMEVARNFSTFLL